MRVFWLAPKSSCLRGWRPRGFDSRRSSSAVWIFNVQGTHFRRWPVIIVWCVASPICGMGLSAAGRGGALASVTFYDWSHASGEDSQANQKARADLFRLMCDHCAKQEAQQLPFFTRSVLFEDKDSRLCGEHHAIQFNPRYLHRSGVHTVCRRDRRMVIVRNNSALSATSRSAVILDA
jgi:hypothetical protein